MAKNGRLQILEVYDPDQSRSIETDQTCWPPHIDHLEVTISTQSWLGFDNAWFGRALPNTHRRQRIKTTSSTNFLGIVTTHNGKKRLFSINMLTLFFLLRLTLRIWKPILPKIYNVYFTQVVSIFPKGRIVFIVNNLLRSLKKTFLSLKNRTDGFKWKKNWTVTNAFSQNFSRGSWNASQDTLFKSDNHWKPFRSPHQRYRLVHLPDEWQLWSWTCVVHLNLCTSKHCTKR